MKKLLFVIMIMALISFTGCSSRQIVITTTSGIETDSLGIKVTSQLVDAVFNSVSSLSTDSLSFMGGVNLAIDIIPQLISSIKEYQTAVNEVSNLSDSEILALVSIGDSYDLGDNAAKIKQVFKVSLFAVQTYFVFYKSKNVTAEAFLNDYKTTLEKMINDKLDKQHPGVYQRSCDGFSSMGMGTPQSTINRFSYGR